MESSLYKDVAVSRGFNYRCYVSPPSDGKPYLLLIHGFPSTSQDWRHQVPYFQKAGYGVIAPDMLGYGGTAKPKDPAAYTMKMLVQDLVDILDAEKVDKVAAIGHDWGSGLASRLANYHEDQFIGFAFLSLGYSAPMPPLDYEKMLAINKETFGYELFGYWGFFTEPDAAKLIMDNLESYFSLSFAADPKLWIPHLATPGGIRAWLDSGKTTPVASYISEEDYKLQIDIIRANGFEAPLNYYKAMKGNLDAEENADLLAKGVSPIAKPTFLGACLQDYVCLAPLMKAQMSQGCSNVTVKDYDAGHWIMFESKEELAKDLVEWLEGI